MQRSKFQKVYLEKSNNKGTKQNNIKLSV